MIKSSDKEIFESLPDKSIVLCQCRIDGKIEPGMSAMIAERWPKALENLISYCEKLRILDHSLLLGTFCPVDVSLSLVVCYAFAQDGTSHLDQRTSYDAWHKICRNIEILVRTRNEEKNECWTLHSLRDIGCGNYGGGKIEQMQDIFRYYFEESPVHLTFYSK